MAMKQFSPFHWLSRAVGIPWLSKMARISAIEASADGVNWTFSPMVDICRDARWGRIAEGSGEDPYLGSLMAKAYVRGYQGKNLHFMELRNLDVITIQ